MGTYRLRDIVLTALFGGFTAYMLGSVAGSLITWLQALLRQ